MTVMQKVAVCLAAVLPVLLIAGTGHVALAREDLLVTGKSIHQPPLGSTFDVGSLPMNMILSPDGRYAICTDMGFREKIWAIDTATGKGVSFLQYRNSPGNPMSNGLYYGLAFGPDGKLYAAQGGNDSVLVCSLDRQGKLAQVGQILATHKAQTDGGKGPRTPGDFPSGLATDSRGHLYVADNTPSVPFDASHHLTPCSLAIYNTATGHEAGRYEFSGINYPLAVAALKDGSKVYVTSQRDGKVYVLDAHDPAHPVLLTTIPSGSHPVAALLSPDQTQLYVANAQSDTVSIIDTASDQIVRSVLLRPQGSQGMVGVTPTSVALAPDGKTLYVTLGDMNAVAAVDLPSGRIAGYIPAGWYPSAIVASPDGTHLLVANAKGSQAHNPNAEPAGPDGAWGVYSLSILEGNVQTVPIPDESTLKEYTSEVIANNSLEPRAPGPEELALKHIGITSGKIQHVIYVVKENRSYDQVFGDITKGNGDAKLAIFGKEITPNQHALADRFVLLDNFYVCGEVSGDGWPWSTQGFGNEYVIKNVPYGYSDRGRTYDYEGQNDGLLTGGHPARDVDGKLLSPTGAAPPVPDVSEGPSGYIWDAVRKAGRTYRNYGFFLSGGDGPMIPDNYPDSQGVQPEGHNLAGISDYDYRRFDLNYADSDAPLVYFKQTHDAHCLYDRRTYGKFYMPSRFSEWKREFDMMLAKDPTGASVPNYITIRLPNNHTQGLVPGKHSPRSMVADNDYAVGELVQTVSKSPIWDSTVILIVEDDAQNGQDHVDCHRSPCLVISPWVKRGSVDSAFYNTVSVIKTTKLLLGVPLKTQYEMAVKPFGEFWDSGPDNSQPYQAVLPAENIIAERNPLKSSLLPGSLDYRLAIVAQTMDFRDPDSANTHLLNEMIWKSVKGFDSPVPAPVFSGAPGLAESADTP